MRQTRTGEEARWDGSEARSDGRRSTLRRERRRALTEGEMP